MNGDPATQLLCALARRLGPIGNPLMQSTDWASATFCGARHLVWIDCPQHAGLTADLANLLDAELPMTGHFVADLDIIERHDHGDHARIGLAALTIEL